MKVGDIVVPITDDSVKMVIIGFDKDKVSARLNSGIGVMSEDNSLPIIITRYMNEDCNSKIDYFEKAFLKHLEES